MRQRIPEPVSVRLPHAEIQPTIRPSGLTFVVLDQARATKEPIARLYYYEIVEPLGSNIELIWNSRTGQTKNLKCARASETRFERLLGKITVA